MKILKKGAMIKMTKYYYLYEIKIENKNSSLDGCYYYGKHITSNLNDNYFGSGLILNNYKEKYSLFGLTKTILCFFENEEELNRAENDLIKVKKEELKNKCLNLNDGGHGSFTYINNSLTPEQRHENAIAGGQANKKRLENPEAAEEWRKKVKNFHANMSEGEKEKRYSQVS